MGLLDKIFPEKKNFYDLLLSQAEVVCSGMSALYDYISDPDTEKGEKVELIEEEADEMRRVIIDELNRSFVTPLDREDIMALSRNVDDIIDYGKSTVEEMSLFEVKPDKYMKKMAEALKISAGDVYEAVKHLRDNPGMCAEFIIKAKKAENFVEHRYREGLVELFKSNDVINILKKREIYRHLSNAADRAAEAANIISDIVMKST